MSRKRPREDAAEDDSSVDEDADCEDSSSDRDGNSSFTQEDAEQDAEEKELPGIIENVTLVNFLCHRYLTVPFGPRVNFHHRKEWKWEKCNYDRPCCGIGRKSCSNQQRIEYQELCQERMQLWPSVS
ncbi:Structural maintenance of chromosomes protein 6 [Desmophyllum pertusum]|uniref:Structural maintenance of chromosomes protein 6 n=1 Tax=Desmophyllum pertusum TaxID=174260 RepID=A0A9X0A6U3_9CNID|nr:Structural maintenance of chromosomes protein 6 [Desmophyllum pertusum]